MDFNRFVTNLETRRFATENIYSEAPKPVNKKLRFYCCRESNIKENCDELPMSAGDILAVKLLGSNLKSSFLAKNLNTGQIGFTYLNNVYPRTIPEFQPWYSPAVNRGEAEELLIQEGNETGSFLVRSSMTFDHNPYALSIRCIESENVTIRHYKILKNSFGFYIHKGVYRETLEDLIELYLSDDKISSRLCQKLSKLCIMPTKRDAKYYRER